MKYVVVRILVVCLHVSLATVAHAQIPSASLGPGESLGAYLGITRVPNLRDLGGYATQDGRLVARGMAYRSNELYSLDANDLARLQILQLKNDYDLRTPVEISAQPDTIPVDVNYVTLNVMADEDLIVTPAQIDNLFLNPKDASKQWGGEKGIEKSFIQMYRDFVSLPSAKKSYQALYLGLSKPSRLPGIFHCTNGKDRTGWGAAALLALLGVPRAEIYADYLRSNQYLLPMHQSQAEKFISGGGDPGIPDALFGVKQVYLDAAFDEMHRQYGTIDRYFSEGLNIDAAKQQEIRQLYLVQSSTH